MPTIDPRNPPNEFPDIVGAKPANPFLASFKPYIPAHVRMHELTLLPLIVGTLLGMVFGASSLYLVLKVGLTVSASIPVAVLSITIFRIFSKFGLRDATILENNIVQTAGSAGESIAFGLGVTMPAIMILGFDLEIARVMLVAVLGGLLGILMMIPLRRALIVDQHGLLKYPEGTACAEVLKAAAAPGDPSLTSDVPDEQTASGGKTIFTGFGIGFIYQAAMGAYPFETVRMMAKIATHTESSMDYGKILDEKMRFDTGQSITGAIGQATCDIAHDLNCVVILTASATGRTARVVSRYRPRAPIICATNRIETYQRLSLVWGVHPVMVDIADDSDSMMQACIDAAGKTGLVKDDDIVVLTGGVPVGRPGSTNFIKIHRIGQPLRPE